MWAKFVDASGGGALTAPGALTCGPAPSESRNGSDATYDRPPEKGAADAEVGAPSSQRPPLRPWRPVAAKT